MAKSKWAPYPHDAKGFAYAGDALKKAWPQLHAGDAEPFPDAKHAAALLKACTVEMLVERCARVEAGATVLVHAAAGGVGLILVQWP